MNRRSPRQTEVVLPCLWRPAIGIKQKRFSARHVINGRQRDFPLVASEKQSSGRVKRNKTEKTTRGVQDGRTWNRCYGSFVWFRVFLFVKEKFRGKTRRKRVPAYKRQAAGVPNNNNNEIKWRVIPTLFSNNNI